MDEGSQKGKMSKSWGKMYRMVTVVNNTTLYV